MQNYVPSPMEARSRFVLATPNCPICKTGMRLVQVTPIIFSPDLDEGRLNSDECEQSHTGAQNMELALKRIAISYEPGGGKWPQLRSSGP
jgi:hypothetical protein